MQKLLLLFTCTLFFFSQARSQDYSNKGKEFWIGYGNHVRMFETIDAQNPAEEMQLYMTSDVNTSGSVTIPGVGLTIPFSITANNITTVDIPRSAALLDEGTYNLGIHVTADKPIVVYSFIYVNAISGATLCLPVNTLGKDYYSVNYTQVSNSKNSYSYFDVIATDTGTTSVEIIPSQNTKSGHLAGVPFVVNLTQGQVYQALGQVNNSSTPYKGVDLTGSQIRSISTGNTTCKKIAVFCGSGKISIGCAGAGTSDNLYQQMYPVSTWGKTYITVPTVNKSSPLNQNNYYRIFKSDPSSNVTLNGSPVPASGFVNNQYYEFESKEANYIESDKPVLVAQYLTTSGCSGNGGQGDPEMIYLNPVEQTISSVTLNSMQPAVNTNINEHHLNVVLKNNPSAISSFRVDGVVAGQFTPLVYNSSYAYAQITVAQGPHTLTCDSGFNAIAYGFGNAESYGYSAGTNLKDLYQFVSIQNKYATVNFPAGCRNSPFKFSMTFPYKPVTIKWQFRGLFTDTTLNAPGFDSSWVVNGRTLYRYILNRNYVINTIGTYPITIVADNPTADGCSGEQEINYDLQIYERPQAAFTLTQGACLSDSVVFKDLTNGNGRAVTSWAWSFGDGVQSGIKDPIHTYGSPGSYTIRFNTITDIGCLSDTTTKTIQFTGQPVAGFSTASAACEKTAVQFSDLSSPQGLTKWNWNFGDGGSSSQQNPVHTFVAAGNYTVTLDVQNSTGCKSSFSAPIKASVLPHPNFGLPEICVSDAFAQFTDSSTIADNSQGQFQYLWHFGDRNANATNPDSAAVKNAQHRYTAAGIYDVKLRVTSKDGCSLDTTRKLTINGAQPKADFILSASSALCSNKDVTISDQSTVDFGNITHVEIYWDYANDPTIKTVDQDPATGKSYTHRYPAFGTPATRDVQVVYVAYSGISCLNQAVKTITLQASPVIQFDSLAPVCEELPPFPITGVKETSGLQGIGVFSGTGITSDGTFTPKLAKAGLTTLRYTFTAANGCTSFAERTIKVNASPLADAGPDRTVLENGSITIAAKVSPGCSYLWTPGTGILNNTVPNPQVSPTTDITYTLKVVSPEGCTSTDQVSVTILKDVKVPNAFSPNGDGVNDTWSIPFLDSYPGATVQVFNRYGQLVFSSVGYSKEWNGTYNGSPLPLGTYYWIVNPKNGRKQISGSVTILR